MRERGVHTEPTGPPARRCREFDKFGKITDCFMPKDRETNEPRGFGFVTFDEIRDAEDAIREMDGCVPPAPRPPARPACPTHAKHGRGPAAK